MNPKHPLTPDYQSAGDARRERSPATSAATWLTTLAFFATLGTLAKSFLIINGILPSEKPVMVLMLIVASVLTAASLLANAKQRIVGGLAFNALSLAMLGGGFVNTSRAWV